MHLLWGLALLPHIHPQRGDPTNQSSCPPGASQGDLEFEESLGGQEDDATLAFDPVDFENGLWAPEPGFCVGLGQSVLQVQSEEPLLASLVKEAKADPRSFKGNIPFLQAKGGIRDELQRRLGAENTPCRLAPAPTAAVPVTNSLPLTNPSEKRSSRTAFDILAKFGRGSGFLRSGWADRIHITKGTLNGTEGDQPVPLCANSLPTTQLCPECVCMGGAFAMGCRNTEEGPQENAHRGGGVLALELTGEGRMGSASSRTRAVLSFTPLPIPGQLWAAGDSVLGEREHGETW